jgi:hypothetical protein
MLIDLCFISDMLLWLWLLCLLPATEFWLQLATTHLLTTMHLVAPALFPHAQIIRICPSTVVICSGMVLLLWL